MFRVDAGKTARYCDGVSRRSFLQLGVAGMAAVGLDGVLRARADSAARSEGSTKDTAVILIWLDGGPSHMDLYDLKPAAPAEYRGLWKPIRTAVPGLEISELFPKQARVADKFSVVRSLHHGTGDHYTGAHHMLTGRAGRVSGARTEGEYPSVGSIVARLRGPNRPGVPAYVAAPTAASIGLTPGYFGANYLGTSYNPFELRADPNAPAFQVPNLRLAGGLTTDSLDDRRQLVHYFDDVRRTADTAGTHESMDRFQREAFDMVTGAAARRAFDLSAEDPRLRDRYGRNTWGQSTLLARRLVEAGATFVTAHFGGWDHHWDLQKGMENHLPMVDAAVSTLLADLDDRGLLERTLVVLCGEFSRTPRMNDGGNGGAPRSMGTPGRDHWGNAMFCLLGGGGVKGGQVVGSTDHLGTAPKGRPCTPADIHATIYHVMGVDPTVAFLDRTGRPVHVLDEGKPIAELL
jgi:uncharacterized protein (DUF1501 family)